VEEDDRAEQAKELKLELYAERAEAGLPLFDEGPMRKLSPGQTAAATVRAFHLSRSDGWP